MALERQFNRSENASVLTLKIREGCEEPYVEFHVDGDALGQRVKAALGAAGYDDVLPCYGIDYDFNDTVLGTSARTQGAKSAIFLACGCGCYGCSGVSVDVVIAGETLTLRDFSTWRGDKTVIAQVDPVVFDRRQFENAVLLLERDIEAWRPPPKTDMPSTSLVTPPVVKGPGEPE